jgi:hypothetical protein
METIEINMVSQEISPERIVDGKVVEAIIETKPVLTVTRTQESTDKYTMEQINQTITNIEKELANVQERLDYQYQLKYRLRESISTEIVVK